MKPSPSVVTVIIGVAGVLLFVGYCLAGHLEGFW